MPIRSVHDSLESEQREILAADRKRWKHMGAGGHLSDWMAFLPGMELRRAMAFSDSYILLGNQTQKTSGLGNAVTPPVSTWITGQALATIGVGE